MRRASVTDVGHHGGERGPGSGCGRTPWPALSRLSCRSAAALVFALTTRFPALASSCGSHKPLVRLSILLKVV